VSFVVIYWSPGQRGRNEQGAILCVQTMGPQRSVETNQTLTPNVMGCRRPPKVFNNQKKMASSLFQIDRQLPPTRRPDHVLGLFLTQPIHLCPAIPLDAYNLARTLTLGIHYDKKLGNLDACTARVEMHLELARPIWSFAVYEPLVVHVLGRITKIQRVDLRGW